MEKYYNYLNKKLTDRRESGILRQTKIISSPSIDFSSNDFLGYSVSGILRATVEELKATLDISRVGSTGSRLITGNSEHIEKIENEFSRLIGSEASLFFNSGYMANLAVLSCLSDRNSLILYDENVHASLKDGMRNGLGDKYSFKHNNYSVLEGLLAKYYNDYDRIYVITEGLYSMDGDIPDLSKLLHLCEYYEAALIIDEAHSLGTCGENQMGISIEFKDHPNLFARIFPLGKAAGTQGAFVCGAKILIEYLMNFSRPFIFTTAPTLDQVISVQASILLLKNRTNFDQLQATIKDYLELQSEKAINRCSNNRSPIQFYQSSDIDLLKCKVLELESKGISIFPIFAPTVRKGEERLRIILHSFNKKEDLHSLLTTLN